MAAVESSICGPGSNNKRTLDLELRLGLPCSPETETVVNNCKRAVHDLMTLGLNIYFPRSSSGIRPTSRLLSHSYSCESVRSENDLELRLGVRDNGAGNNPTSARNICKHGVEGSHQPLQAIKGNEKDPSSQFHTMEMKLKCLVCMDFMQEETSTWCGHIFCYKCIKKVIKVQRKCPTCRQKLSPGNIHRVYLPNIAS